MTDNLLKVLFSWLGCKQELFLDNVAAAGEAGLILGSEYVSLSIYICI